MKTLLLGWRSGNVADEWMKVHGSGPKCNRMVMAPPVERVDLRDPADIQGYLARFGPFDEVVYCAGRNRLQWISDMTMGDMHDTYAINVFGLVEIVSQHHALFDVMPKRIVAIVSDSSRTPMRGSLAYSSSKAALVGVLKNMARELAPDTVVVGVSPGIIEDTPMTDYIDDTVPSFRGWDPEAARKYENTMIPMQRRATKREVAQTMEFALTGPEYLSGSIIEITGGK